MIHRYIIIAGNCFQSPQGGMVFTSLSIVGLAESKKAAFIMYRDFYEKHGGLIAIIDKETDELVQP